MVEENMENNANNPEDQPQEEFSQEELDKLVEDQTEEISEDSPSENNTEMDDVEKQMQEMLDEDTGDAESVSTDNSDSVQMPNVVQKADFPQFNSSADSGATQNIGLLLDVPMPVSIELGKTTMNVEEILNLSPGSVVELNKLAGEPVDLLVNNKVIAKGEVVVVDENFGVRVTTLIPIHERSK